VISTVIVNTGDDEEFYGLHVSPDIDTILYTLAGVAPPGRGWGCAGRHVRALGALERLYGPAWFQLGDRDLATHIFRTEKMKRGWPLSRCVRALAEAHGVRAAVLPATDDRLRTQIDTAEDGWRSRRTSCDGAARPRVRAIRYDGGSRARPAPGVVEAIERADVILIAPSNPFVSIGPILAVREVRRALRKNVARAVAISPLVGGRAIKGRLQKCCARSASAPTPTALARFYRGLARTLIVAPGDAPRTIPPRLSAHRRARHPDRAAPRGAQARALRARRGAGVVAVALATRGHVRPNGEREASREVNDGNPHHSAHGHSRRKAG
jgi:LPPG:FO 2-phospho-L-lactate transferase